MKYNKTLRWLDPYGGWGDHSSYYHTNYKNIVLNNDTGFANRVFHWEVAYEINKRNNFKYRILLLDTEWPELDLIDLPNTSPYFFSENINQHKHVYETQKLHFITLFDEEKNELIKTSPLNTDELEKVFLDDEFKLEKDNYFSNFGFRTVRDLYLVKNPNFYFHLPNFDASKRPLKKIKLKHRFIEKYIKKRCKNYIGLHLRRFNGVNINENNLNSLPHNIKEKYVEIEKFKDVKNGSINFYDDDLYFNIIDEILKINKHERFYLSQDLPEEFISHYKEKYGDTIITKQDFLVKINNFLFESNVNLSKLENYGNVVNNIVDLFCLSHCKMLIEVPKSSWSEFARDYIPKQTFYINDDLDKIIKSYKTNFHNV